MVCDETMGNLIVLRTGLVAFTTGMRMRYLQPILVDETCTCVASLGAPGADGQVTSARAEILNSQGILVASSTATYLRVPFSTTRDRISLDDEDAERLDRALTDAMFHPTPGPPARAEPSGSSAVTTSPISPSVSVADITAALTAIVAGELGVRRRTSAPTRTCGQFRGPTR